MELPLFQRHVKNTLKEAHEKMGRIKFDQAWNFTHSMSSANSLIMALLFYGRKIGNQKAILIL